MLRKKIKKICKKLLTIKSGCDKIITEQKKKENKKKEVNKMEERGTWAIMYHYIGETFEDDCLARLVTGTKERAKETAERLTKETGKRHWVKDGTATLEAFSRD
jgi:hypothetical protein